MLPEPNFRNGDVPLYLGDCIPLRQELPEESIDFILAETPYTLSHGGLSAIDKAREYPDLSIARRRDSVRVDAGSATPGQEG